jgi:hypothetical protein
MESIEIVSRSRDPSGCEELRGVEFRGEREMRGAQGRKGEGEMMVLVPCVNGGVVWGCKCWGLRIWGETIKKGTRSVGCAKRHKSTEVTVLPFLAASACSRVLFLHVL